MKDKEQGAATRRRGDTVRGLRLTGHRVALSRRRANGFTLLELVMTITVMTVLTLGVVPLVKVSVKRQKEQQLRETLREIRAAIDQFHREAIIYNCAAQGVGQSPNQQVPTGPPPFVDPRTKVMITDCTIFGVDNPDRYPPSLEILNKGVNVLPIAGFAGGRGQQGVNATDVGGGELATKTKIYLRSLPIDPMTGQADWGLRSCYDSADSSSWGGENVFDVRSKSKDTALNGEKYSDW